MKTQVRIARQLYNRIMADMGRPHSFAYERIGFCRARIGNEKSSNPIIFLTEYWSVPDDQYIADEYAGARINSEAIRNALQSSLSDDVGIFHIHMHDFPGIPSFSPMDRREIPRIVQSLTFTNPGVPHGMLVFGRDKAYAEVCMPNDILRPVDRITVVGHPTQVLSALPKFANSDRFSRQTFLGHDAPERIDSLKIGIVGLSGGGSHIAQQASHTGFANFALFDAQAIDCSNLNRLVGGTEDDVLKGRLKISIADRVITSINGLANTEPVPARWQDFPESLRSCDIVFGCLDGFDERRQLEAACRRYLIPLIDVGMDVTEMTGKPPRMAGQVILSLPGYPCFHCIGFLNERNLAAEAARYGDAGINPQVVWPNGVLASTAVGIAVDLVTDWRKSKPGLIYKSYDGNSDNLTDHPRFEYVSDRGCPHYPLDALGDP